MAVLFNPDNYTVGQKLEVTLCANISNQATFTGTLIGTITSPAVPPTANAAINHANIWPSIPAEIQAQLSDDYRSYKYIILQQADGTIRYIGTAWIITEATIIVGTFSAVITVVDMESDRRAFIRALLEENGFTVASIV